ncbi:MULTISPECIES: beta-phosphoglucomutase [unclassified Cellulophaga]|uniref:beta-phosphoglucomutase n=2 Tax=Cellulophaga TaxID=104264 RepID=UPI0026E3C531|nr:MULTISPECIES: beta-phosphoglucomutase [unclassified Cellulophaga]MDO6492205.1 beta-phosphoglucomutase [Cellulophaga sp. 2_MG-2023]MDO6493155.1 beta-phosphoglucomutase [Cellulophaga sp. 3_MG-2023]
MKRKGFIFDLDGVIVDTAKYHFLAWQKLANSIGVEFTHEQNEQLKGVSRVKSLEKILNWGNITLENEEFIGLMAKKNEDYLQHIEKMDASEILPDVPRILELLETQNQGIALGSASKNAEVILQKVSLIQKFSAIIDGNGVTKGKPDPEVFLNAANALSIAPEDCIVFEDATAGIDAANAANMISIGIGDASILSKADYVFKDFTEISSDFIQELIKK